MPSPVTTDLTVEDIDEHLDEWSRRYRAADSNSLQSMSRRALDNWLDLRLTITGQREWRRVEP